MKQTHTTNRRLVLAERPEGAPTESTLRLEIIDVPSPREGEMLPRTEFLSLDPYMRGRMSDAPSYAPPVAIGGSCYPEFTAEMGGWLKAGKIHYREEIVDGLERAPATFIGMLDGRNFGKCVIRVGPSQ